MAHCGHRLSPTTLPPTLHHLSSMAATQVAVCGCSAAVQARRPTQQRAQAAFVAAAPARRMASVSSITAAASVTAAAPARAVHCRAAAALSVRSEISCECACVAGCIVGAAGAPALHMPALHATTPKWLHPRPHAQHKPSHACMHAQCMCTCRARRPPPRLPLAPLQT